MKRFIFAFWPLVLALPFTAGSARSAEIIYVSGLNFMVDWQTMIGKQVLISGGLVRGADHKMAVLFVPGGTIYLMPPWYEREDLRYLFNHCTSLGDEARCKMEVTGIVGRFGKDEPMLSPVDFIIPK